MIDTAVEFVDTNVLLYAADFDAGAQYSVAVDLMGRLADEGLGAISTQVLIEFYSVATRKLRISSAEAEATIQDLAGWMIHRPDHSDVVNAILLQRRYRLSWFDALIVNSAIQSGARILWTEDLNDGQKFGHLTVRNPFRAGKPKVQ